MRRVLIIGVVLAMVLAGFATGVVLATDDPNVIHGCVNNMTGILRVVGAPADCRPPETPMTWSVIGPPGPEGPPGPAPNAVSNPYRGSEVVLVPGSATPVDVKLIDTRDGSVIAMYPGYQSLSPRCNAQIAVLTLQDRRDRFDVVSTVDGSILATFTQEGFKLDSGVAIRCDTERALATWFTDAEPERRLYQIIDLSTWSEVASFDVTFPLGIGGWAAAFNCSGDRTVIPLVGLVETVTGTVLRPEPANGSVGYFLQDPTTQGGGPPGASVCASEFAG